MKVLIIACVVALAAVAVADDNVAADEFDFDKLFEDKDKTYKAFACVLGKAPCGDLQKLKEAVVNRLETNCAQCTPAQREKYNDVLAKLKTIYPELYKQLTEAYKLQ